jgi:hypothetical protein
MNRRRPHLLPFASPLLVVPLHDILVVDGRIDVDVDVEDGKYVLCTNLRR